MGRKNTAPAAVVATAAAALSAVVAPEATASAVASAETGAEVNSSIRACAASVNTLPLTIWQLYYACQHPLTQRQPFIWGEAERKQIPELQAENNMEV